jgi:predicted HNH restriction endonuclease
MQHPDPETPMLGTFYPDELPPNGTYIEGSGEQILVNRFERSLEARNACIAHHGSTCQVCELDFSEKYGELGAGFIHVHHRVPIASVGTAYCVDPVNDLVPVCPNCHSMLHRREPPLEIEELRALVHGG